MDPMADEIPDLADDDPSFGPAMRKLTPLKRKFVLAVQILGSSDNTRAAILAGYGQPREGNQRSQQVARNAGWRLAHDPEVQSAMLEEAGKRLGGLRFRALDVLRTLVDDVKTKPSLRLRAGLEILNRTGMPSMTEQNITVTHELGPQAAMIAKIKAILRVNPSYIDKIPPQLQRMLEPPKEEPINAEFTVVRDPDAELFGE
jgi:hypothetical protein